MKRTMVIVALAGSSLLLSGCSASGPVAVVQEVTAPTSNL